MVALQFCFVSHPLELRFVSTFCVCSAEESRIFEDFVLSLAPEGQSTKDLVNNGAHKKAKATNGCLVLDGCHAFLECRTLSTLDAGDHSLIYAEVKSGNSAGRFIRFFYFHPEKCGVFMIQFDLHTFFFPGCFSFNYLGKVLDEKVKTDIRSVLEASKLVGLDFKVPTSMGFRGLVRFGQQHMSHLSQESIVFEGKELFGTIFFWVMKWTVCKQVTDGKMNKRS